MSALLTDVEAADLHVGVNVIIRPGDILGPVSYTHGAIVAPQEWVALTGPCPTCDGKGGGIIVNQWGEPEDEDCPDCQDGRRIVPLYRECPDAFRRHVPPCDTCNNTGQVLVGRGSIEVVPVVERFAGSVLRCIKPCATDEQGRHYVMLRTKPLVIGENNLALIEVASMPVPGRDFGIVIDVTELV